MIKFLCLNAVELFEIMSVLKQNLTSRPPVDFPHKIMVWFSDIANHTFKSETPKGAYFIHVRLAHQCSDKCKAFVETLWDRGYVTIEIVRNDGTCAYFSLPRDAVLARDISKVIIMPVGEDPSGV